MLFYLSEVNDSLNSKKGGMEKNSAVWENLPVKISDLEQMINEIKAKDAEVEEAKQQYTIKLAEARKLCNKAWLLDERVENLIKGMHGTDENKLLDYNVKLKKSGKAKERPNKIISVTLEDDADGEGFIVSTSVDSTSDYYEWQKGFASNAADVNTIPEMKIFKTTKKSSFVDDDVPKGVRVFYQVRAANSKGTGPWSTPVSRVQ